MEKPWDCLWSETAQPRQDLDNARKNDSFDFSLTGEYVMRKRVLKLRTFYPSFVRAFIRGKFVLIPGNEHCTFTKEKVNDDVNEQSVDR